MIDATGKEQYTHNKEYTSRFEAYIEQNEHIIDEGRVNLSKVAIDLARRPEMSQQLLARIRDWFNSIRFRQPVPVAPLPELISYSKSLFEDSKVRFMPAHQYFDLLGQLLAKVNNVADISLMTLPEVNRKFIVDLTRHTLLFEQINLQTVRGFDKFLCEYLTPAQTLDPDPLRRFSIYAKLQRNYVYQTEHGLEY